MATLKNRGSLGFGGSSLGHIVRAAFFILLLSSCASVRINGVKVKESAKVDNETMFYLTTSFLLGFGVTNHFAKRR